MLGPWRWQALASQQLCVLSFLASHLFLCNRLGRCVQQHNSGMVGHSFHHGQMDMSGDTPIALPGLWHEDLHVSALHDALRKMVLQKMPRLLIGLGVQKHVLCSCLMETY